MPRMSSLAIRGRFPLQRAARVHQLLRQGVRVQSASLHTISSRLRPLQNTNSARQTKVLQVYLKRLFFPSNILKFLDFCFKCLTF